MVTKVLKVHRHGSRVAISSGGLLFLSLQRPPLPREQQADSNDNRNSAVHRPSDLPGHEAARKDVDALEEPDGANCGSAERILKSHAMRRAEAACKSLP